MKYIMVFDARFEDVVAKGACLECLATEAYAMERLSASRAQALQVRTRDGRRRLL